MTCIVGYIDKQNKIMYMGGDSAGVDDLNLVLRKDTKVFIKEQMIFGYTSSFRMGQLLRFRLKIPQYCTNIDIYEYMCTDFIDAVRQCLKENGYSKIENNNERIGTFLVAFQGHLFCIEDDLQVEELINNYNACGCGKNFAISSIRTLDNYSKELYTAEEIINTALHLAEDFSAGVRQPFIIQKLKY